MGGVDATGWTWFATLQFERVVDWAAARR